jgi:hypothetical protein
MNNVPQLGIRLHLDGGSGEVRWGRRDLVIGFPFPLFSMAEPAKLVVDTLAFL